MCKPLRLEKWAHNRNWTYILRTTILHNNLLYYMRLINEKDRIRTYEAKSSAFTVQLLWPLGYFLKIRLSRIELPTFCLSNKHSTTELQTKKKTTTLGIEPRTFKLTAWRSNLLSYIVKMTKIGFEPMTSSFSDWHSSYWAIWSKIHPVGLEPTFSHWKCNVLTL